MKDVARARPDESATRGVSPPAYPKPWAGAAPTSPSKDRSPLLGRKTPPTRRKTKEFISQLLLHRPRHVALVDVVGEPERVLGIKRGVRRN